MPDAPSGSLKSFGMNFDEGVHESDRDLNEKHLGIPKEGESDEPKGETPADKLQSLVEIEQGTAVAEEPEVETEDTGEGDVDPYDTLLDRAAGVTPSEVDEDEDDAPRLTASEQHLREAYAKQQGRLEALEDRIKERPTEPETAEEAEPEGPDYNDPRVQKVLAEALSDPERVGPTLKVLIETEAQRLLKAEVGPLAEQLGEYQAKIEDTTKRSEASAQVNAGLQKAYSMGGIESAVVRQAQRLGPDSLLVKYLRENPSMATSAEGVVAATMLVARAVQLQEGNEEQLPSEQQSPAPAPLTPGKRPTVSSKRGKKLTKPKEEKSEEDTMREMIRNSRRQSAKLDFLR